MKASRAAGVLLPGLPLIGAALFLLYLSSVQNTPPTFETGIENNTENQRSTPTSLNVPNLELIDFEYWVSIKAEFWWRYAYRLEFRSKSHNSKEVRASIKYIDSDGAVIDSTTTNILTIPAGEEKSFTGHSLIGLPGAKEVEDAEVSIIKYER